MPAIQVANNGRLRGERIEIMLATNHDVALRQFEIDDIPLKVAWINDPQVHRYLHYDLPLDLEKTRNWFLKKDNTSREDLVILYRGTPVGLIGLLQIDAVNRKAEFYISIGETSLYRSGIGSQASLLLLRHAFCERNLHKVYLNVDADNIAAISMYEKLGFRKEGVFHDDLLRGTQYVDRVRYAIFAGNIRADLM